MLRELSCLPDERRDQGVLGSAGGQLALMGEATRQVIGNTVRLGSRYPPRGWVTTLRVRVSFRNNALLILPLPKS